ncbi:hypothetical protein [Thermotoga sp. KOL6]|uniref:DUF6115 domain-containing protein n=1 Tax=Thermotoga sp. KOL6 TaxID=126741 RepID=UPI000C756DB3|nr:hypothetical protein [Thermotoga sp. KOL6]PLV59213.1 hypothetical protein AS005_05580 [Thermotoga sp. KOL6]
MSFLDYLVVISTLGTVVFSWTYLLLGKDNAHGEIKQEEIEERIMELMGKFRYMSANRLELLDRKTQELKKLIAEANTIMSKLMVRMSEIEREQETKIVSSSEETAEVEKEEKNTKEDREGEIEEVEKDFGLEKRIVSMYDRGFSEVDIAKELGITIGEVRLVLQLFKRSVG